MARASEEADVVQHMGRDTEDGPHHRDNRVAGGSGPSSRLGTGPRRRKGRRCSWVGLTGLVGRGGHCRASSPVRQGRHHPSFGVVRVVTVERPLAGVAGIEVDLEGLHRAHDHRVLARSTRHEPERMPM